MAHSNAGVHSHNAEEEDQGVNLLLDTLTKEYPGRALKNRHITKDKIIATLAFLTNFYLSSAKDIYDKYKVKQLIKNIIT